MLHGFNSGFTLYMYIIDINHACELQKTIRFIGGVVDIGSEPRDI